MLKILGLDLGTDTGIAFYDGKSITAETWKLGTAKEITAWGKSRATRRGDPRVLRFFNLLHKMVVQSRPDVIAFEDVEFQTYTKQTQLWSSFRTVVWLVAAGAGVLCDCVGVSSLKLFGARHGGATKEMMRDALFKRHPEFNKITDHNTIDAIWVTLWATNRFARLLP